MPATAQKPVAFQGEHGAFSEEAALRFFGPNVVTLPCRDFEAMFQAVVEGDADCAVVPIENTLAGSVIKNYDLLLENAVTIVGEVVVRVVHNLIGLPGAKLEQIRRVYSHPVALAQCETFLRGHAEMEVLAAYDTAGSVKDIVAAGNPQHAAVAAEAAARAWNAQILAPGIESNPQNFTRFVIVQRSDRAVLPSAAEGEIKTSIVFEIRHQPGGLFEALRPFAEHGINLSKIESRPIPGRPWEYTFYLDFLGAPGDPRVTSALADLRARADDVRVLGSYRRA